MVCIGSFQKDGVGWGDGLEPKLIKGPDALCDVLEVLAQEFPIYILLTGPARGYVKKRLTEAKIPFAHYYLKNYPDIVKYYQALDLYIVASRVEGGPKAILECMACGIPLVTTDVGLASDIITSDNKIAKIAKTGGVEEIVGLSEALINGNYDSNEVKAIADKAIAYDWSNIAKMYYEEMYQRLIE